MIATTTDSALMRGNIAQRQGLYAQAMHAYGEALQALPELAHVIVPNMVQVRRKYCQTRLATKPLRVAVCGWELAHNAAGRAYTLAMLYQRFASTELIGNLHTKRGQALWEPIRHTALPKHTILLDNWARFLDKAIDLVTLHPYDVVHLSKPRAPNIIYGLLYKLIWGAKVLVDVDDEELAFVRAQTPITIADYLEQHQQLPALDQLEAADWTRIAVGLAGQFDGVTVSNPALQARYGGEIVRHARDEALYQNSPALRQQGRAKHGVAKDKKVVLFFGTPKAHKGLLETAQAIASLARNDVLFVIVGNFLDAGFKQQLQAVAGVQYQFIGNQPFEAAPEIVAMADIVILLQQNDSPIATYQLPAKLGDALAMDVLVLATPTPAIVDACEAGAILPVLPGQLPQALGQVLDNPEKARSTKEAARRYFERTTSFTHNGQVLQTQLAATANRSLAPALQPLTAQLKTPWLQALLATCSGASALPYSHA
ncbi:MAG: glycosyltransferase [Giesbergeria sp.]|uniref:glycosyltransferase n=1 Tax=Giesbergeria sp. TaxID=2818473 RepID=UPI0026084E2B|nr:glycosyltransferase [Giesbergeria sp.]MDD2608880.1 glycosyltransferase [Giesbergeria sp.]